ncbi:hypothetical protein P2318_11260 [Myxococcaceae bacterium GXIMD 01537]
MSARPPPVPAQMPRGIRIAAVLCLVLSFISGMFSVMEASGLANFEEFKADQLQRAESSKTSESDRAMVAAHMAALSPIREPRAALLMALSVACALSFVASGRMLRPAGLPRDRIRRLLGGAVIACAVLRTIDGAQFAAALSHMSPAMIDALLTRPEIREGGSPEQLRGVLSMLILGGSVAHTALMAGAFALLGQYFRSNRVREAVLAQDGPTSDLE